MTFVQSFMQYWSWCGRHWSTIIPAVFFIMAVLWIIFVYSRDKFRFLPAIAIARVTVQDSIGRLEVISLMAIGMLAVGGFSIILFYEPHMETVLQAKVIQDHFANIIGGTGIEMSLVDQKAFLCDLLGYAAMFFADIFIAIIAFILSMFLIPNEINRGVVHSILPKPITRGEYIFGKFLGTWLIVTGCFLVLSFEVYIIELIWYQMHQAPYELFDYWKHYPINKPLFTVMFFFPFKYAVLILLIMGMSLRMPEAPAGIVGLLFYIGGHSSAFIYDMSRTQAELGNVVFAFGLKYSYWVLPHLADTTVSIMDPFSAILQTWDERWGWIWQVMIYNFILLWLVSWLFRRRSL